jgi:hypothetical protein
MPQQAQGAAPPTTAPHLRARAALVLADQARSSTICRSCSGAANC